MMVQWDPKTLKIVKGTMNKPRWLTIAGALMRLLGPETVKLWGKKYIWWGDYHWRLFYSKTGNPYMGHVQYVEDFFKDKTGRLLDVGCGEGLIMKRIAENSKLECYGIDSSPLAIEFAHQHQIENCQVISFKEFKGDEPYDFIFMGDFLEHVEDPEAALRKGKNLLAEDGLVFISLPLQVKKGMDDLHFFTPEVATELVEKVFLLESYSTNERFQRMYFTGRKPEFMAKLSAEEGVEERRLKKK